MPHRRWLFAALLLATACGEGSGPSASPLIVRPANPSLFAGDTLHLNALFVTSAGDTAPPSAPVTWSILGSAAALSNGVLTGLTPGSALVSAQSGSDVATVEVVVLPPATRPNREIAWLKVVGVDLFRGPLAELRLNNPALDRDTLLTDPAYGLTDLAWVPDGSGLVVNINEMGGPERFGLWFVPATGVAKPPRRLAWGGGNLAWSPDGRSLAFAGPAIGGFSAVWVVDIAAANLRQLTFGPAPSGFPAWSPDGRRIAFRRGGAELWTMRPDGSGPRLLYRGAVTLAWPTWSPDGRYLAFTAGNGVRVVDSDGGGYRTLSGNCDSAGQCTPDNAPVGRLYWSPDGRRLVYATTLLPIPTGTFEVVEVRGGGRRRFSIAGCGFTFGWAPDGLSISIACFPFQEGVPSRRLAIDETGTTRESHAYDSGLFFAWRP